MNNLQILRAVLYTRVSTEDQADTGTSLASQLEACQRKASELGAIVVKHCEDAGVSGAYFETRPAMQEALSLIESGAANLLIVSTLSRYSRNREHQSAIKRRVQLAGGRIVFCDMDFAATPEGDLAFGIMGSFADYERNVIRERTMRGKRKRAEEGVQTARSFPAYGYHVVSKADILTGRYPSGTEGTYQSIPEQARWIREMFELSAKGDSIRSIARYLNANGVPTAQGKGGWNCSTIHNILRNPVHKGEPMFGTTERVLDESRLKKGYDPHYYRPAPPEKWIKLSAPVIVDPAMWEIVQGRLAENKALKGGNPKRRHVYSGLLRCPRCGGSMIGFTKRNTQPYYACCKAVSGKYHDQTKCPIESQRAERIHELFLSGFRRLVDAPEHLADAIEAERRRTAVKAVSSNEVKKLRDELTALDAEERATVEAQIQGIRVGANPAIYASLFEKIAIRRAALEGELTQLKAFSIATPKRTPQEFARQVADKVKRLPEIFTTDALTAEEKHDYAAQFIQRMIPTPEGMTIYLRPEVMGDTVQPIRI